MKSFFVLKNGSRGEIESVEIVVVEDIVKYLDDELEKWKKMMLEDLEGDERDECLDYIEEFSGVYEVVKDGGWWELGEGEEDGYSYYDMSSEIFSNWVKRNNLEGVDLIKYFDKLDYKDWCRVLSDVC